MTTIKLRRSTAPGSIPLTTQLSDGEVALNTNDGILYFKKTVSGTNSIVALNPSQLSNGTQTLTLNSDGSVTLPFFSLPATAGTLGQVLTSSGTGSAYWSTVSGGGSGSSGNYQIEGGSAFSSYSTADAMIDGGTS